MIQAENLRKNYNGRRALDGLNLRVARGEVCGLVGPNGAGKTTLIKILATLIRADAGAARINGIAVAEQPYAVRKLTGFMPDIPGLYQDMRVQEFLEFFADAFHLRGGARAPAVTSALQRAGMAERAGDYVEELSLGMKQRLVLAKTLLHNPQVLLLDEPATGLDPLARVELRELLKALNRDGITILVSSHILADLQDICTRVCFIAQGKNAAEDMVLGASGPEAEGAPTALFCELEFLGEAAAASAAASQFNGARVTQEETARLRVEIPGPPEIAADFLAHMVRAGIRVVRFDRSAEILEERYRKTFGEPR